MNSNVQAWWNKSHTTIPEDKRTSTYAEFVESQIARNSVICEVGAASGVDALFLLEHGHTVIALDIADVALEVLEQKAKEKGFAKNLTVKHVDFNDHSLPIPDNTVDCVFCKQLADGSLRQRAIYEDDEFIAFFDSESLAIGHTLVIPKEHVVWVWDYKNIPKYFAKTAMIAKHLRENLGVDKVSSLISGGTVSHAHIHLIPDTLGVWIENFRPFMIGLRSQLSDADKQIYPELVERLKIR